MNDICNVSKILTFVLFADDTTICTSDKNVAKQYSETNRELNRLYTWLSVNKLSINIKKTNYIVFSNIHENVANSVGINNTKCQKVYLKKFIGVFIDHKLTWQEHINYACGKICKCTAMLNKVKNLLNKSSLHMLYNSLFIPYLTYCTEVWGNTYKTHLKPLFLRQRKAIPIVNKAKYLEHTDALFNTKYLIFVIIDKTKNIHIYAQDMLQKYATLYFGSFYLFK